MSGNPGLRSSWEPPRPIIRASDGPREGEIRLSLRIVVHLSGVRPVGDDGVGPLEATQEGMSVALAVTQGAVSKILRRLVAAEVVRPERRHDRGQNRRVKVYALTHRGESLAREIRQRFGLPPVPWSHG
jgi:Transcriptional regulator PadR-like family